MIEEGDIIIFSRREAETLREIIYAWEAWKTLGTAGRLVLWVFSGALAVVAMLASITGRWPWLTEMVQWGGHVPPATGK